MCTGGRSKWCRHLAAAPSVRRHTPLQQVSQQVADRCKSLQAKQQLRDSFNGTHSSESFSHSGTFPASLVVCGAGLTAMRFPKQRYLALLPRCQPAWLPLMAGFSKQPHNQPIDLASWLTFQGAPRSTYCNS